MEMKFSKSKILISIGAASLAAAALIALFNIWDTRRAYNASEEVAVQLAQQLTERDNLAATAGTPNYILNPEMDMPIEEIEGREYIGTIEIPALELSLPVISEWSYPALKVAPCRYFGSAYTDNLIIAAHNYATHFGSIKTLHQGDSVIFTDIDGNTFAYEVIELETLQPTAVEQMMSGDWDLTLFTCTIGGRSRVTLRCERVS